MSSEVMQDAVPGSSHFRQQQGKRAACDRCRGQKLKCLREPQAGRAERGKCIRCHTAGAVCSFSQLKRAGRPPTSTISNPAERRSRGKYGQGKQTSLKGRQSLSSKYSFQDIFENQYGENYSGHTNSLDEFVPQPLLSSFMNDTTWDSVVDIPWMDEGSVPSYDGEYLPIPTGLDTFIQDHNWNFPCGSSGELFSQPQPPGFNNNLMTARVNTSTDSMSDSLPSMLSAKALNPRVISQNVAGREGPIDSNIEDFKPKSKDNHNLRGEPMSVFLLYFNDGHHQRMRGLSELGMNLFSQVIANEEYNQAQVANGPVVPCEKLVGNILKSSVVFLKLLASFYPSATNKRPKSKASTWDSSDAEFSPSEASIFSDFSDLATVTTANSVSPQNCQWKRSAPVSNISHDGAIGDNDKEPTKPMTADMTTILQLLTCYIRIIHLHSIFYTQVHDYLSPPSTKQSKTPFPPIFPGMHVGGLSLDHFPNFQIKFLLQISMHLLGEIEKALGLPDGYRISEKSPQNQGILEASVSVQFVEMTMRENVRTGLMGIERDRVKSIRDKLASLRVLLKGTINI